MNNKQNESEKLKITKSFLKSQEILKKTINSINSEREEYKKILNNSVLEQKSPSYSYQKTKSLYKNYKYYLTQNLDFFNKYKGLKYNDQKNFIKYKTTNPTLSKQKFGLLVNKMLILKLSSNYFLKTKVRSFKSKYRNFKKDLLALRPSFTRLLLKNILFTEKYFLYYLLKIQFTLQNKFSNSEQFIYKRLLTYFTESFKVFSSKSLKLAENCIKFGRSFDKKRLLNYLNRFLFILKIYFLPFIFLANQALIPFIQEYEELIVNSFSSSIFQKLPFLVSLVQLFNPIINSFNKMFQFWVLIAYFLIFPLGYRSLKLSYKLGYNGSIALIFLLINSSLSFSQEIIIAIFESLKMTKDIVFTSYLVKHIGKSKNKEREEALRIFNNLVQRYEIQIRQDYFNWLLFLNHYILSPLAFISIAVLVYNCLYYIIYNKNPKIPLVTKAALATIKNPQEEE